jgi:hypothetical protein
MDEELSRRRFVQMVAAVSTGFGPTSKLALAADAPSPRAAAKPKNLIGIQVNSFAWLDEGIDKVLDNLQEKGNINTVFAFTFFTQPTDVSGKIALPDHGTFGRANPDVGGAYYDYDPKYFRNTTIKDFHAPTSKFNVITEVGPKMRARGIDFYAWDYNNTNASMMHVIPGFTDLSEVDVYGRRTDSVCWNNPNHRAFLVGRIESLLSGYPEHIDGVVWGCERMGPLDNMIGGGWATTGISCFCEFCCAKARARDISVKRAKQGYLKLEALFKASATQQRPVDGYFVTFWRILLEYPEILSWHRLWNDSYHEVRAEVYGTGKTLAPQKPFGFHIVQNITFSPFYSASDDYSQLKNYADFIKIATYNNCGGGRLALFLKRLCSTVFADATPDDLLPMYYKFMNYDEKSIKDIAADGLSPDYIAREIKRAIADTGGTTPIYAGIDIDVPPEPGQKRTTPDGVKKAVKASYEAGANGVVLSREYTEMWLANLAAAGDATRELFGKQGK